MQVVVAGLGGATDLTSVPTGLPADSAGKLGVESEGQNAETTEQIAGTAEQGTGTTAARSFHPVLQSGMGCSAVG
jgi:hypothetical protein